MVICKVQDLLNRDWVVQMVSIYREANRATDYLANLGHSLQLGVYFYLVPPNCLGDILRDDLIGISLPRLGL